MGAYGSRLEKPPKVATDQVIPTGFWDDMEYGRTLVVEVNLRFDEPLDSKKIFDALARLMNRKGWRKLGARLRLNVRCGTNIR